MKALLTGLVIFIYTFQAPYANSIVIEHVGLIDKPIPTIKITDDQTDTLSENKRFYNKCAIDKGAYLSLRSTASFAQGNILKNKYDYGTFKLSIIDRGMLYKQYFLDRKKAILLFDNLIRDLKQKNSSKQLISYLEANKKRINY